MYSVYTKQKTSSFNFGDLQAPVPASAYYGMPRCDEGDNTYSGVVTYPDAVNGIPVFGMCTTIYDAAYAPVLAVPPEFRALDPAWGQCLLGLDGLWDPPKALQPASTVVAPTAPGEGGLTTTTQATPAQSVTQVPGPTTPAPQSTTQATSVVPPATPQSHVVPTTSSIVESSQQTGGGDGGDSSSAQTTQASASDGNNGGGASDGGADGSASTPAGAGSSGGDAGSGSTGSGEATSGSADSGGAGGASSTAGAGSSGGDSGTTSAGSADQGSGSTASAGAGGAAPTQGAGNTGGSAGTGSTATGDGEPGNPDSGSTATSGNSASESSGSPSSNAGGSSGGSGAVSQGSGSSSAGSSDSGSGSGSGDVSSDGIVVSVGPDAYTVATSLVEGSSVLVVADGGSTAILGVGAATTLGSQLVTAPTSGGAVIGTGNAAVTVAPGQGNQGSSGTDINTASVATVGDATISADPSNPANVVIEGSTLSPGQTTLINQTPVSVASGALVVGGSDQASGSTIILTTASPALQTGAIGDEPTTLIVSGHTLTASADPNDPSAILVNGSPVQSGGGATINGVSVTLGTSGLLVDGSLAISPTPIAIAAATFQASGDAVTVEQIGGKTVLVAGQSYVTLGVDGVATVNGVTVNAAQDGLVVGGTRTIPISAAPATASEANEAVVTLSGHTLTASQSVDGFGGVVIDGTTLQPGSQTTIDGAEVSVGASGLIIDGSQTVPLSQTPIYEVEAAVTLNGITFTAVSSGDAQGDIVIDGTTLHTNGPAATINGIVISDASDGLVVGETKTVPFTLNAANTASSLEALITVGSSVYTAKEAAGASYVVIDGTTLSPGGTEVTINGVMLSDAPSGLVIGGTQTVFLSPGAANTATSLEALLTLSGQTYTAVEPVGASYVVIDGTTLSPGGSEITIDGAVLSDGSSGLVMGQTKTIPFSTEPTDIGSSLEAVVTIGGHTYTAAEPAGASYVVIDGKTLSSGGSAITLDGTVVSEGPSGLVIGGTRTALLTGVSMSTSAPSTAVTERPTAATTTSEAASRHGLSGTLLVCVLLCSASLLML
ncbi:hypothetical protein LTR08_002476 [Meristemomyces frigidus]|nr:hypothetical protein LTR08_002476 [Meristemomyces frigidus]